MSLWLRKRGPDGKAHYYTLPFDPFALISVVGIVVGLALTVLYTFCELTHRQPTVTALAISATLGIGFSMFAIAKCSVMRSGTIVSFGPSRMSRSMRRLYCVGYATLGCACLLAFLFIACA